VFYNAVPAPITAGGLARLEEGKIIGAGSPRWSALPGVSLQKHMAVQGFFRQSKRPESLAAVLTSSGS